MLNSAQRSTAGNPEAFSGKDKHNQQIYIYFFLHWGSVKTKLQKQRPDEMSSVWIQSLIIHFFLSGYLCRFCSIPTTSIWSLKTWKMSWDSSLRNLYGEKAKWKQIHSLQHHEWPNVNILAIFKLEHCYKYGRNKSIWSNKIWNICYRIKEVDMWKSTNVYPKKKIFFVIKANVKRLNMNWLNNLFNRKFIWQNHNLNSDHTELQRTQDNL